MSPPNPRVRALERGCLVEGWGSRAHPISVPAEPSAWTGAAQVLGTWKHAPWEALHAMSSGCPTATFKALMVLPLFKALSLPDSAPFKALSLPGSAPFKALSLPRPLSLRAAARATVLQFVGGLWTALGGAGFSPAAAWWTAVALDSSGAPYVAFQVCAKPHAFCIPCRALCRQVSPSSVIEGVPREKGDKGRPLSLGPPTQDDGPGLPVPTPTAANTCCFIHQSQQHPWHGTACWPLSAGYLQRRQSQRLEVCPLHQHMEGGRQQTRVGWRCYPHLHSAG